MSAIKRSGLRVSGASGDRIVTPTVVEDFPDTPIDLLIIAVKAGAVADAAAKSAGAMERISRVVTIQNGLGSADTVADVLGGDKLAVGIAQGFGASLILPGHVHHNDMKAIRLGTYGALPHASIQELAMQWRQVGFDTDAVQDILTAQWEKLICNVAYSAPCALTGLTVGEAMQDGALGPVTRDAAMEAYDVARALDIPLSFDDPVAYVRAFAERMPDAKPSVLLDIESGKKNGSRRHQWQHSKTGRPRGTERASQRHPDSARSGNGKQREQKLKRGDAMTESEAILAADANRRAAMISANRNQLESIFSERLVWTHSSGAVEHREAFIANIESGSVRYLELDTPTIEVMTLGDSWLCVGELAGRAERDGVEKPLKGRFLSAWTREAGALKMVAWQTTPLS